MPFQPAMASGLPVLTLSQCLYQHCSQLLLDQHQGILAGPQPHISIAVLILQQWYAVVEQSEQTFYNHQHRCNKLSHFGLKQQFKGLLFSTWGHPIPNQKVTPRHCYCLLLLTHTGLTQLMRTFQTALREVAFFSPQQVYI